ncbi:MAG: cytochrome c oxidase subunit II [Deltaproteobacteria bacterium]|nr:cytochrome c oxidase subunit II [Deltaproteobacteria bacterium]
MFRYLPEQASDFAHKVDWINNLITDISVFFTVAIVGSMIAFAIIWRKRDGKDHETPRIEGSHFLEAVWTIVPTIISIYVAAYGYVIFDEMRDIPEDAPTVNVTGQMWRWDFLYPNGKKTTGELVVPVDEPVKLLMTSRDVLHSFFIPAMRVKMDVIPKQFTSLWFRPVKTGEYRVFCTEYCGRDHSSMLASLRVLSKADYERWLNDRSDEAKAARMKPADLGKELYTQKGCNACHSLDGSRLVGPSFLKLYGKEEALADGTTVKVDENYLSSSITNPNAQIVAGFPPNMMPSFAGQVTDDELFAMIEFIKSIEEPQQAAPAAVVQEDAAALAAMSPEQRGKRIYETKLCITCHSLDGSPLVGPTFKGLYGKSGKLADGSTYVADEEYIRNSVYDPASKVVEGFAPAMPSFQGQLSEEDVKDLIEFLKTVK